jgi:outer membrane cobalamin receptor
MRLLNHKRIRWATIIATSIWWWCDPSHTGAETSFSIPRASSETERQIQDEALYLKEETVSIASRYEQPISRAPSDVYVITDEDIRNSGATDIPTLLRQVPGMEVMQTNSVDFNVSVRGNNQLAANKLLVLVDGRSIYVDQAGIVFWKQLPVALTEIRKIEVLKGPASAVYGFNAFDGVINIITKSPEEMKGTTLQVGGGELGTLLANVVQAGTSGNWGYRLSGGHEQTQRWSDHNSPSLNGQRIGGVVEYYLSSSGKVRAEAGLARSNPYNGIVTEVSTGQNYLTQTYGLISYEQGGLLIRGWWNGLFSETIAHVHSPLSQVFTITDRFGRTDQEYSLNTYDFETRYRFNPHRLLRLTLPGFPSVTAAAIGSTDVKPEHIISHELGYQGWWWEHRLRTRMTGFFNHISDLIAFRNPTNIPTNTARPLNGGVADVYGGEVGVEVLMTSWLSVFANYAYQEVGQSSSGFSRRGFPHHKVNAGLRATWSPITGEMLYHHVGDASYPLADAFTNLAPFFPTGTILPQEHVPSYNLLNLRLGYLLWRQQAADYVREAELAVSVFNALNDRHREHPLGDILGTRVMGWLTVKL